MVTAMAEAPEPAKNEDYIRAVAGAVIRALGIAPEQALPVAVALIKQGIKVDFAEQDVLSWAKNTEEAVLKENLPRLSDAEVRAAADAERLERLEVLAHGSANQLVPDAYAHYQIDGLLTEMGY